MLNFFQLILIYAGVYAIMAIGQNCITGYTGMLSLCHAGFFCVGSYATAIICKVLGFSFWLSLPVAAIISGVIGFLIGVPTLRLKGDYLCIATLGLGEIIRNVATNLNPVGISQIPRVEQLRLIYSQIFCISLFPVSVPSFSLSIFTKSSDIYPDIISA